VRLIQPGIADGFVESVVWIPGMTRPDTLHHGDAPHYYERNNGYPGIELSFFLACGNPFTGGYRRLRDGVKKRRSSARIGRYFGLIEA